MIKLKLNKNRCKNKKAETTFKTIMFFFVRLFMLSFFFVAFVVVVNKYIFFDLDTIDYESEMLIYMTFLTKDGPSFYDKSIDRNYPFFIDAKYFLSDNKEKLNEIFDMYSSPTGFKMAAMKIILLNETKEPYKIDNLLTTPIYLNEDLYNNYLPIAKMSLRESKLNQKQGRGPGSIFEKNKIYYVNIIDNNKIKKGFIEISVLFSES
jgi:hypothetical protein